MTTKGYKTITKTCKKTKEGNKNNHKETEMSNSRNKTTAKKLQINQRDTDAQKLKMTTKR